MKVLLVLIIYFINFADLKPMRCNEYEHRWTPKICLIKCPVSCGGGTCQPDGTCKCKKGFTNPYGSKAICVTKCSNLCTAKMFGAESKGSCLKSALCRCVDGSIMTELNTHCLEAVLDECYGTCSFGVCSKYGCCNCPLGFTRNIDFDSKELRTLRSTNWREPFPKAQQCVPSCTERYTPDPINQPMKTAPLDAECFLPNLYSCSRSYQSYNLTSNSCQLPVK